MSEGLKVFRRIQIGIESTAGTITAATVIVRADGTMEDGTVRNYVDESVGYFVPTDRSYEAYTIAKLGIDSTPVTFEQLPYFLTAGIKQDIAGTQDGAGSGYIYTFDFSTTSANTIDTLSIEAGDNQQEWESAYFVVKDFEISGEGGGESDAVMFSANLVGREWEKDSFSSLSLSAVEEVSFSKSKLYIDAIGGTMGNTQKTSTMVDFALSVTTGAEEMFTGDGSLTFTDALLRSRPEITLELGMLYNSDTITEIDNWLAGTSRQIEIKLEGSAFNTAGTDYSNKTIKLQLPGSWETFSGLDEVQGGDKVTGTFKSGYNTTAGAGPSIIVVNDDSAL